jgi:transposase
MGLPPRLQAPRQWLKHERQAIDPALGHCFRSSPRGQEQAHVGPRVPGVGPVLARTLVAQWPERGTLNRQEIAVWVGVAPLNRARGTRRGNLPWVGRALPCPRRPVHKECSTRLRTAGKAAQVALTGCMRKLVTILKARLTHQTPWHIHHAPTP